MDPNLVGETKEKRELIMNDLGSTRSGTMTALRLVECCGAKCLGHCDVHEIGCRMSRGTD